MITFFNTKDTKTRFMFLGSTLRGMVTREVVLTSMGFLDLCLSVKGHLAICIEVVCKRRIVLFKIGIKYKT